MFLIFEGRSRALEREHNERAWMAWHIAALYRTKRLPPLRKLMNRRRRPSRPQSWEQQLTIVRMLNAAYGGSREKK